MMRHALITGAAEGIGRALAEVFGLHHFAVTGVDVNGELAAHTQEELAERGMSLIFHLADLGDAVALEQLTANLIAGPPIDVLVHNAGISCVGAFARSDLAHQRAVLAVNLRAPIQLTAALLHANKIAAGGAIIFISSLARFASYPGAAVYGASKAALAAYARSLVADLAAQDIHVLVVYPGPTRTSHARRYSPDNRREARRMPPEVLAASIYRALERRERVLVPGFANGFIARLSCWAPTLVEWVMRKTILEKL